MSMFADPVSVATAMETRPAPTPGSGEGGEVQGEVPTPPRRYFASIYPGSAREVSPELVEAVKRLEEVLEMRVRLLVQSGRGEYDFLAERVKDAFFIGRRYLPSQPIALVVDSFGGLARSAYQIATLIRRRCGGFTAVIPRHAKSAATLLVLGAERILMAPDAELGPLDAQILDPQREEIASALDQVQSLERLFAVAFDAVDHMMPLVWSRMGKKMETLLSTMLEFVAHMMELLLRQLDTVHYTQQSRLLRVAEEYATRLMVPRYSEKHAEQIARHLVEHYPEHEFTICADEARGFGLKIDTPSPEQALALDWLADAVRGLTAIGRLQEEDQRHDHQGA